MTFPDERIQLKRCPRYPVCQGLGSPKRSESGSWFVICSSSACNLWGPRDDERGEKWNALPRTENCAVIPVVALQEFKAHWGTDTADPVSLKARLNQFLNQYIPDPLAELRGARDHFKSFVEGAGRLAYLALDRQIAEAEHFATYQQEEKTAKPVDLRPLHGKFIVKRTDGLDSPGNKHESCRYFVLDIDHDPHARPALAAYAADCAATRPNLARDLLTFVETGAYVMHVYEEQP